MENKMRINLNDDLYKKLKFLGFYCHFMSITMIIIRIIAIISSFAIISKYSQFIPYFPFIIIVSLALAAFEIYVDIIVFSTGTFLKKSVAYNDGEMLKTALLKNAFSIKLTIILIIISIVFKLFSSF
jgi:hypothetical protein